MLIEVDSVCHRYSQEEEMVLNDISFKIERGEFIGLIGHTGSGKSTLVQLLNGLITPTAGQVYISGEDITAKEINLKSIREQVGLVFQYPEHQLFEETVYDDIAFGPKNLGLSEQVIEERVKQTLASVNLDYQRFKERSPFKLSGGQQRRVAIAGVLAMRPEVLILDEPTAGLDPKTRNEVIEEIVKFKKQFNLTIILISHRMEQVFQLADRILVLEQGELIFDCTPAELIKEQQRLIELGLSIPEVTKVLFALKERGYDLRTDLFEVAEIKEEIVKTLIKPGILKS
ncbi:energy-coupling factor transporter ATPase [Fuchsiella alkaliacetigena]|uniref:energy-coupling factor transporter ATPase n=1 Tax=Fuchsiella alkaliacetigena TaxID=957042 RepID=UPI00200B9A47|nr:energy-coupling factor transporter ATPase [Fuchsiella alkaliacetigena]MCK8824377.1 energy-coupling factor transporter ATPase [Fuchsiella alkaliacetigena]